MINLVYLIMIHSLEENMTFYIEKKIHTKSIGQESEHKNGCIRKYKYK